MHWFLSARAECLIIRDSPLGHFASLSSWVCDEFLMNTISTSYWNKVSIQPLWKQVKIRMLFRYWYHVFHRDAWSALQKTAQNTFPLKNGCVHRDWIETLNPDKRSAEKGARKELSPELKKAAWIQTIRRQLAWKIPPTTLVQPLT